MTQFLPPVGLHAEIVEVFENGGERPANELMAMLNTPARIQRRGFPVRAGHLLAVVIDTWRIDEDTRFFVYDFDNESLVTTAGSGGVYTDPREAAALADEGGDNCLVKRFQL